MVRTLEAFSAAAFISGVLTLFGGEPPQEWPKVKPGVWKIAGRQTPAWEAGGWKQEVSACEQTESLFMRKLEGEVTSLNPEDRCTYSSVRLSNARFEITSTCPVREGPQAGTAGLIKTWVRLKGDREFHLRAEKFWPKTSGRPEVRIQLVTLSDRFWHTVR